MSRELPFMIYCLEEYRHSKGLSGKEVVELFNSYFVFDYIKSFYEALHTMGSKCIVDDIDSYIESRRS